MVWFSCRLPSSLIEIHSIGNKKLNSMNLMRDRVRIFHWVLQHIIPQQLPKNHHKIQNTLDPGERADLPINDYLLTKHPSTVAIALRNAVLNVRGTLHK